jgi:hypothetical protein
VASAPAGLGAQRLAVSGRVLYGPAGRPLPGAWVVLHEVSRSGGGRALDSTRTDATGAYTLAIRRADTAAVYVISSRRAGVAYFSEPVVPRARGGGPARLRPLYVYDTSATGPPVALVRRLVTIAGRQRDGTREVLELLELENPGRATRIAPDTLHPTWGGAIPAAALQFRVGEGDVSPQAVTRQGDSVLVFAPLPPGERKQLSYAYVLPADLRRLALPVDQPTGELDLLVEDTAAAVVLPRAQPLGTEALGTRRFARYRATALGAGTAVAIAFPPPRGVRPETLVPVVVALAALALGAGFVVALRRPPAGPIAPARPSG